MPRLVLAHVRQQSAAVHVADRVEPVVRPATRRSSSTSIGFPGSSPTVSRPSPSVAGRRPTATSSSAATRRSSRLRARPSRRPLRETEAALVPMPHVDAALRAAQPRPARTRTAPRARSAAGTPRRPSPATRASPCLRQLDADDAAAEHDQALGYAPSPSSPPGSSTGAPPQPGDRRHRAPAPGRDHDRPPRHERRRPPTPTRRSPSSRPLPAHDLDAALLEPRQLHRVVEVVDHLVASREHRGNVESPCRSARRRRGASRPSAPPAAAAPWTACTRSRSTRRRRGAPRRSRPRDRLAEPSRGHLARRPGTDHDDVEAAIRHRPSVADRSRGSARSRGRSLRSRHSPGTRPWWWHAPPTPTEEKP